jgi:predicted DNA binding CopG/RHH family protein
MILDQEEKELLDLFEGGKLKRVSASEQDKKTAIATAKAHLKKDTKINIRLSSFDLDNIKRIAALEGLPYQTLISSILHKYISSRL